MECYLWNLLQTLLSFTIQKPVSHHICLSLKRKKTTHTNQKQNQNHLVDWVFITESEARSCLSTESQSRSKCMSVCVCVFSRVLKMSWDPLPWRQMNSCKRVEEREQNKIKEKQECGKNSLTWTYCWQSKSQWKNLRMHQPAHIPFQRSLSSSVQKSRLIALWLLSTIHKDQLSQFHPS